jgi:hypothetical protein
MALDYTDVMLDTNVFSYIYKGHPLAERFLPYVEGKRRYLSFMTVGELFRWAYSENWNHKEVSDLLETFENYTLVDSNTQIVRRWAWLKEYFRSQRNSRIKDADAWIGATALTYALPLATFNVKDFENIPSLTLLS